jgi:hypothetical protein
MRRLALVLLALVTGLAACGSDGTSSSSDATDALAGVKPISSATVDAVLRLDLDNAPAQVGDRIELRFGGPMRTNGAGKLPSLDWKLAFTSGFTNFSSRLVSTGNNVFVRLGGADFELGESTISRLSRRSARSGRADGLAAIGLDPLAAVKGVRERGKATVAGTETTRYTGSVDVDAALDQIEGFLRRLPRQSAGGAQVPQLDLTPERRDQVKSTFRSPRFEADLADDDTIRRLVLTTRFVTPEANRQAAGGMTGGSLEYRVEYSGVGEDVTISPVSGARPIEEFNAALQRELAK